MEDYSRLIKMVEDNHENIAMAIAMSYAEGDEVLAKKYYERFIEVINNRSECFFLDIKDEFGVGYDPKVNDILDSIGESLNRDVKKSFFDNISQYRSFQRAEAPLFEDNEVFYSYMRRLNEYKLLGIEFADFKKINEDQLDKLNENIDLLKQELNTYSVKRFFDTFKVIRESKKVSKKFKVLASKYGVKNFDELLTLNEEVGAFLMDEKGLDKDEIYYVNKKKEDFRKRINKDSKFNLTKRQAIVIQKEISDIYNNEAYNELLRVTNFKEFLDLNGYEYTPRNLDRLLYLYFDMKGNIGSCSRFDFGKGKKNLCLYKLENILYGNKFNQNNIILHEFVHVLDEYNDYSIEKPFSIEFRFLNEALTEYFAIEAVKYLKGDILDIKNTEYLPSESAYWCMLPLVRKLKESSIWKDIKIAKLAGDDLDFIERNIGYNNLKRIGKCFDRVYKNRDNKEIKEECLEKLDEILKEVEYKKSSKR